MNQTIFLTGATGFLGTELLVQMMTKTACSVYVLLRGDNIPAAVHRLKNLWYEAPVLYEAIGTRIIPILGDITKADLGIDAAVKDVLLQEVDMIIHAAADTKINHSKTKLWECNVNGTRHMLKFAKDVDEAHGLQHFAYVSTAYVSGNRSGKIMENTELHTQYNSLYEESKAIAEKLVQASGLNYTIFRPSMIVGHSATGKIQEFNTVYYVLKLLLTGKLQWLPVSKHQKINLVPVDYVAESIITVLFSQDSIQANQQVLHLTAPDAMCPTAEELAKYVSNWAKTKLTYNIGHIHFVSVPYLSTLGQKRNARPEAKEKNKYTNLLALMPYFYHKGQFDRTNTDRLLGVYTLQWESYIDTLLAFAVQKNFMHQTARTVFEQANVRRSSKTFPITYYDMSESSIKKYSGIEMNKRIAKIAGALLAMGIEKGDRVAMAGINCTDSLALDMAVGLIGAVSVPIYYTTPAHEIAVLLEKSEAKCFFAGDKRIVRGLESVKFDIPVIAYANGCEAVTDNSGILLWERFLTNAIPFDESRVEYRSQLADIATIRYTSGTTGNPKGVMFNHYQLRWMGEVLTNLLDWNERNQKMRYLSFLPMSHVVEGILAAYAPYYMLADVELYYLNDFDRLTEVLPLVRPTVFFSVPRFYEKLWMQITQNKIGQKYLAMPDGFVKKLMGKVVKTVVLKKAGLDQCSQLIVGSAPVSDELLRKFRALGIEIHNAYGQTEAPLITLNRLGDNNLHSVGTPLPDTQVYENDSGELIAKGPQVACGYDKRKDDMLEQGILYTGDLGRVDETGHVYITGRKKDIIITSYGKNINCQKIETALKNIDCVEEAILIGENRPYCTALLWLDGSADNLSKQIVQMNETLSHPEQIKKYKVIDTPLSIAKGELTPNLKLRKANIMAHYAEEIEALYMKGE
mgnify:CR=1 FL=1